ncbi:MAG: hypothetical protein ACK4M9_22140 [Anaerobacillus sp.]|uniref:hypothetical protein n=1 Tax=Anaerobacillus sp. TaxID=1872506 RepID=UPI00391C510E
MIHVVSFPGLSVECLYYGSNYEKLVSGRQILEIGDLLELKNQGRYIPKKGWFILVTINGKGNFVFLKDLEKYLQEQWIKCLFDIELEKNFLHYQIDKSLNERNPDLFFKSSKRLRFICSLTDKIKPHLVDNQRVEMNKILCD